jgi:hypothetical protein
MSENEQVPKDTLPGVDPAKLRKLMDKLGINPPQMEAGPQTADPADPVAPLEPEAPIDWSTFNLDPGIAHLYPKSRLEETPEGPRFVALIDVFEFVTDSYKKLGGRVTDMVNGSERWRIATVYGNGSGFGVVMFTRTVPMVLPVPEKLKTEAELPPPQTDEELAAAEKAALNWIAKEGQVTEAETVLVPLANEASEVAAKALDGPDFGIIPGGQQEPEVDKEGLEG